MTGEHPPTLETVLLVEDEPGVRALATTLLERSGYVVIAASSAREALELVGGTHGRSIDLLATDVVMPGMSGPDLARRLTSLRPGVPILFLSGYSEQSGGGLSLEELGVHGEVAFLAKPFTPEAIAQAVRSALDSNRTRRDASAGPTEADRPVERV